MGPAFMHNDPDQLHLEFATGNPPLLGQTRNPLALASTAAAACGSNNHMTATAVSEPLCFYSSSVCPSTLSNDPLLLRHAASASRLEPPHALLLFSAQKQSEPCPAPTQLPLWQPQQIMLAQQQQQQQQQQIALSHHQQQQQQHCHQHLDSQTLQAQEQQMPSASPWTPFRNEWPSLLSVAHATCHDLPGECNHVLTGRWGHVDCLAGG
jgi:hypothetical protein